jgi:hypothetical protein
MKAASYLAADHPWLAAFLVGLSTGLMIAMIAVALHAGRRRHGPNDPTDSAGA